MNKSAKGILIILFIFTVIFSPVLSHSAGPQIYAEPAGIDLGEVSVGSYSEILITIENRGAENLVIWDISTPDRPFKVSSNKCTEHMMPSETCTLKVKFAPQTVGAFAEGLSIMSNDIDDSPFVINIAGTGVVIDQDDDFMPGDWEELNGLNRNDKTDALSDTDVDGYTAFEEYSGGTDPRFKPSNPGTRSAAELVSRGKSLLENKELVPANTAFRLALQNDPAHEEANFFYAATRLLTPLELNEDGPDPARMDSVKELLDSIDVTQEGRHVYNWFADFQRDSDNDVVIPDDAPTGGDLDKFLIEYILPEIDGSLANLALIDPGFETVLTPEIFGQINGAFGIMGTIEVDYADVALFKAILKAVKTGIYLATAYDGDIDIDNILNILKSGSTLDFNQVLDFYPDLLTIARADNFGKAETSLNEAIDGYFEASEFIRNETDLQLDDLTTIDPIDLLEEQEFRDLLNEVKMAMFQETDIRPDLWRDRTCDTVTVNMSEFFKGNIVLRDYLPDFYEDMVVPWTMPDPSMGGTFPNASQEDWSIFMQDVLAPEIMPYADITIDGNESDWDGLIPMGVDRCGDEEDRGPVFSGDDIFGIYAAYNDTHVFLGMTFHEDLGTLVSSSDGKSFSYHWFIDTNVDGYRETMVYVYYAFPLAKWVLDGYDTRTWDIIPDVRTHGRLAFGSRMIEVSLPLSIAGPLSEFKIEAEVIYKHSVWYGEYWYGIIDYTNSFHVIVEDGDGDGIPYGYMGSPCTGGDTEDCIDNCPSSSNPDQEDGDSDGVGEICDNCREAANPGQWDANGYEDDNSTSPGIQHYGDACDADYDNNGNVGLPDFNVLRTWFGQSVNPAPDYVDCNGDGAIGLPDFNCLRTYFGKAPGPGVGD